MRRHPTDLVATLWAVLFLGFAAGWFAWARGAIDTEDLGWAAPTVLIVAGLFGIVASLRRPTR